MASLNSAATDAELPVEGVAARLGLPVGMLIRRIEAGDIPARRDDSSGEPQYHLRLSDLGITPEEAAVFHANQQSAAGGAVNAAHPAEEFVDLTGYDSRTPASVDDESPTYEAPEPVAPTPGGDTATALESDPTAHPPERPADPPAESDPPATEPAGQAEFLDGVKIEDILPPPGRLSRHGEVSIVEAVGGPRAELASMTIDPRELVAGLLDRWERTLEQRIYAEQRQRFEAELSNRLHQVKQLQVELQATRAEHAVAQAEKDLVLAAKERELADRERMLADARSRPKRWGWLSRL